LVSQNILTIIFLEGDKRKEIMYPVALLLSAQLCHTLVRSVRYCAFAEFHFECDVFSIRAVDEKQTPTAS
jgi:hypothetical protein